MIQPNEHFTVRQISLKPYFTEFLGTLDGRERSRFRAALSQLDDLLGEDLVIPNRLLLADLANRLRDHLRQQGLEAESVKNYSHWTSRAIKTAMSSHEEIAEIDKMGSRFPSLPPDPDDQQQRYCKGYNRFKEWCERDHIVLTDLSMGTFLQYQRHLLKNFKYDTARSYYSALTTFWQVRAGRWDLPLLRVPEMQRKGAGHYGLRREDWPPAVQRDFDQFFQFSRFEKSIGGRQPKEFRDKAAEQAYAMVLSAYLGYLIGVRNTDISAMGLRDLIGTEDWVVDYIRWHKTERSGGNDANIHQRTLERFAILLEELWQDPVANTYREYGSQLDPARKQPRFEETLIPFADLLRAAQKALDDAGAEGRRALEHGGEKQKKAAAVASHDAFLFALLIQRPLREANIIDLAMGESLIIKEDGRHEILIRSADEKGKKQFRIAFPQSLEEPLRDYMTLWRPVLNKRNDAHIFMTGKGGRLTPKLLIDRTTRLGEKYLGIKNLNPHFFRSLVVSSYLAEYPNQFEMARQLLGHRRLETTLRHYIHIHALHASRRAAQFARGTCSEFQAIGQMFSS